MCVCNHANLYAFPINRKKAGKKEVNPVPSSRQSAQTAEPWVIFSKASFSSGFFILRNVHDVLTANGHIMFFFFPESFRKTTVTAVFMTILPPYMAGPCIDSRQ